MDMVADSTPTSECSSAVWSGTCSLDDDDEIQHVAVAMIEGVRKPFFYWKKWRETAPEFGLKIMAAWADSITVERDAWRSTFRAYDIAANVRPYDDAAANSAGDLYDRLRALLPPT